MVITFPYSKKCLVKHNNILLQAFYNITFRFKQNNARAIPYHHYCHPLFFIRAIENKTRCFLHYTQYHSQFPIRVKKAYSWSKNCININQFFGKNIKDERTEKRKPNLREK